MSASLTTGTIHIGCKLIDVDGFFNSVINEVQFIVKKKKVSV